jgi:hypothetical protein
LTDRAQAEYIEVVKEFLPLWYEGYVMRTRRRERDLSLSKGPEGARELKDALNKLNASVPDLIRSELEKEDYWDHRRHAGSNGRHVLELRQHPFIRRLLGHVALLLKEHGYLEGSSNGDWYSIPNENLPRYKKTIVVNDEVVDYFREYLDLAGRLHRELVETESLTAEEEQLEIDDMWYDE